MTAQIGLTLLELLIALTIVAILGSVGAPAYKNYLEHSRSRTISIQLYRMLNSARAESINRGRHVTLCGTVDGETCQPGRFDRIIIFLDDDRDGVLDAEEIAIHESELAIARANVSLHASFASTSIVFNADGSSRQAGGFHYCPQNNDVRLQRKVTFSMAGRSYIARQTNAAGRSVADCD